MESSSQEVIMNDVTTVHAKDSSTFLKGRDAFSKVHVSAFRARSCTS